MLLFQAILVVATLSASDVLIDTSSLSKMDNALVVDARDSASFLAGHIPGASHLDVDSLSEEQAGIIGMLKPLESLVPLFAAAGLDPTRPVVVYSGLDAESELKQATRLFWALEYVGFPEVYLLDGGLRKWRGEERPVEQGPSTVGATKPDAFGALHPSKGRLATKEDVLTAQSEEKGIIADLREAPLFTGASKKDFVARGGHISGAVNQPAPSFVDQESYTFKAPDVIRELLARDGAGKDTPVITYCNTGRDATIGYAAYRIAGFEHVAMYDGSMAEWGNEATCPMSSGGQK